MIPLDITSDTQAIADFIWNPMAYVVLGLGLAYTIGTKAVQFRRVPDMVRQLRDSTGGDGGMSSFQALAMALASRVGVGSIAGVATAIGGGGPGALLWMAVTGLLGCTVGYAEACLSQTFKRQVEDEDLKRAKEDIGGMPYYIRYGLNWPKVGALIAVLGVVGYGLVFPGLQVSTIASSWSRAFGLPSWGPAVVVTGLVAMVIFGGTVRLVKVTQVLVPLLAFGYLGLALAVIGILLICMASGLMMVVSGKFNVTNPDGGFFIENLPGVAVGPNWVQESINTLAPGWGPAFVAVAVLMFGFACLLAYFYVANTNLLYLLDGRKGKGLKLGLKLGTMAIVFTGSIISADFVWAVGDIGLGLIAWVNLFCLVFLFKIVRTVWKDYEEQARAGLDPHFDPVKLGIKNADFWLVKHDWGSRQESESNENQPKPTTN